MNRQGGPSASADFARVQFDGFELDEANARLLRHGQSITLSPTPFAVLCALARRPGNLVSKGALLDAVWGHRYVSDSALKSAISELRSSLGDDARHPRYIETVSKRGYRFIGATGATTPAPLSPEHPSSAAAVSAQPIIGRADELARLQSAWSRSCSGERSIVWVAGDPGIGKTTLVDHFVSSLDGGVIARGQCIEQFSAGEPYFPVLEALAQLCRNDSSVLALLRAVAPSLLLELPWLTTPEEREALRRDRIAVQPYTLLRELGEFIDRYTETHPLLLLTEDLHWSDHATIQLIDHVARRRGNARLMWLATFRLAEAIIGEHPLKALRHELRLHRLCEEIVLDGFSEQDVADYVGQRASSIPVSESLVRALHERTDGLPLFLAHLVNDFCAHRAPFLPGTATLADLSQVVIPESLAEIIDLYIARLTDDQRVVLESAAVCGVQFRIATVEATLGLETGSVARICYELARDHLWLVPPQQGGHSKDVSYAFRHALVREVLYNRIGPLARRALHRNVGTALERERSAGIPVTAAELAMHFEYGAEPNSALRYLEEAARAALQRFGVAEALDLAQRGLDLLESADHDSKRDALELSLHTLCGVSAAHLHGASSTEAVTALSRAYALLARVPRHPLRALVLYEYGFVLCLRADYAEALALAERMEALSQQTKDPALLLGACTVQGIVQMLRGRPRASREWLERGLVATESLDGMLADAPAVGDPRITLLGHLAVLLVDLGLIDEARKRLDELASRARSHAQPLAQCVAIWLQALCEVRLANAKRVAGLAEKMRDIVAEFPFAHGYVAARLFGGWAEAHLDDPLSGYRTIRAAYEDNMQLEMRSGSSETLGYATEALLLAGDFARGAVQLDEALQVAHELGEGIYLPQLFLSEAVIADARADAPAARTALGRALAEARQREAPWLELNVLLALCRRDDVAVEHWRQLSDLVARLATARDTSAYATAQELLEAHAIVN